MKFEFCKLHERIGFRVIIDDASFTYDINYHRIIFSDLTKNELITNVNGLKFEQIIINMIESNLPKYKLEYYKFVEKHLQRELDMYYQISDRFGKIKLSDICKTRLLK